MLSSIYAAWCPRRLEEGTRSPWTGITDGCELLRGCWELNLCPLEEQLVFLTTDPALPWPSSSLRRCFSVLFKRDSTFWAQPTLPSRGYHRGWWSSTDPTLLLCAELNLSPYPCWASASLLPSLKCSTRIQASDFILKVGRALWRLKLRRKKRTCNDIL